MAAEPQTTEDLLVYTRAEMREACRNNYNAALQRRWAVTTALLEALALIMVDSEEKLSRSHFREFLENNELGLALGELLAVVNDR